MVTTDNQTESEPQTIDPGAFNRVKSERDTLASQVKEREAEATKAKSALQEIALVDDLYQTFKGAKPDDLPDGLKDSWDGRDFYALAKRVAPQVIGQENPAQAAIDWLADMSSLLSTPAGQAQAPPPPMAGGPNPAAEGIVLESGPFKVGSDEWKKFVETNGQSAANQAILDGQFYFSDRNLQAQETAYSL